MPRISFHSGLPACVSAAAALLTLASCSGLPAVAAPGREQVVVGFYENMTIVTANVYANVEVRAKSYGPGFCTTHVTAGDKTVIIAAPPTSYTTWKVVNSHSGALSFALSKRDQCDTGTEIQVRYWK